MKFVITYKAIYVLLLLADLLILAFDGFGNHLSFKNQDKSILYVALYAVCRAGYLAWNSYNLVQLYRRKLRVVVYLSENLFSAGRIFMDLLALIPMTIVVIFFVSPVALSFWGPLFYGINLIGFTKILGLTYGYIVLFVICLGLIAMEVFYMKRLDALAKGREKI